MGFIKDVIRGVLLTRLGNMSTAQAMQLIETNKIREAMEKRIADDERREREEKKQHAARAKRRTR